MGNGKLPGETVQRHRAAAADHAERLLEGLRRHSRDQDASRAAFGFFANEKDWIRGLAVNRDLGVKLSGELKLFVANVHGGEPGARLGQAGSHKGLRRGRAAGGFSRNQHLPGNARGLRGLGQHRHLHRPPRQDSALPLGGTEVSEPSHDRPRSRK